MIAKRLVWTSVQMPLLVRDEGRDGDWVETNRDGPCQGRTGDLRDGVVAEPVERGVEPTVSACQAVRERQRSGGDEDDLGQSRAEGMHAVLGVAHPEPTARIQRHTAWLPAAREARRTRCRHDSARSEIDHREGPVAGIADDEPIR